LEPARFIRLSRYFAPFTAVDLEVYMRKSWKIKTSEPFLLMFAAAALLITIFTGCGSMMMSTRQLQSITVSPASADAKNSSGMVQFMAMGSFNMVPMTASTPVRWSLGNAFSTQPVPAGVSIDSNGLAHCSGFIGMITIEAVSPVDPNMPLSQMTMNTMNVTGMSQLTCP
jgi:hypothetical protein